MLDPYNYLTEERLDEAVLDKFISEAASMDKKVTTFANNFSQVLAKELSEHTGVWYRPEKYKGVFANHSQEVVLFAGSADGDKGNHFSFSQMWPTFGGGTIGGKINGNFYHIQVRKWDVMALANWIKEKG